MRKFKGLEGRVGNEGERLRDEVEGGKGLKGWQSQNARKDCRDWYFFLAV